MNRRTARTAALLIAGTTLLTPALAAADPILSATTEGVPITDHDTGLRGQYLDIVGTGCDAALPSDPTYMGEFVGEGADPLTSPWGQPFETETIDGGFTWNLMIPLDNGIGEFDARWYCSTSPVTTLEDPAIQWMSPLVTMTIGDAGQPNAMGAMGSDAASPGVTFTTDPDGLPAVDKMGITGGNASRLKALVDARADQLGRVQRMYAVFFGRPADQGGLDYWMRHVGRTWGVQDAAERMSNSPEFKRGYGRLSDEQFVDQLYRNTLDRSGDRNGRSYWEGRLKRRTSRSEIALAFADSSEFARNTTAANYVATAFLTTTGRVGSPATMAPFVEQIQDGAYKVQVIEDIALTAHTADWWNRRLG